MFVMALFTDHFMRLLGAGADKQNIVLVFYFNDFFAILTLNTIYIDGINVTRKGTRMLCAFPFVSIRVFEPGFDVFDRSFERSVHSKV